MDDTNVQLTLDLGGRALATLSRLNNHYVAVQWDFGPNVTLACKYLGASLILCKLIEVMVSLNVKEIKRD